MNNVTVTGNSADTGGGEGIYVDATGTVNMANTILAKNTTSGIGPDCFGVINSLGYNLVGDTSSCTINGASTGNIAGTNPLLKPYRTMAVSL